MKKYLAFFMAIGMAFVLAACSGESGGGGNAGGGSGSGGAQDAAAARDTLTVAVTQDFGTLDFIHESGRGDFVNVSKMYCEPLFDIINTNGDRKWMLATELEQPDPTKWIFHLREGVTFTNGNPFTAEDVIFTLDIACNTAGQYPYFPKIDFANCKALDDYTVEINFHEYDLAYMTNFTLMGILDAESYDPKSYATNPVGTGPYVVTDYVVNSHLNMTANADYWGEKAKIENLSDLAKQYAEEANLVGKSIRLVTNGSPDYVAMAEIIQQNLSEIGIGAEIINYDEATYNAVSLDPTMFDIYLRDTQAPTNSAAQNYNGWIPNVPRLADCAWLGEKRDRFMELNSKIMSISDQKEYAAAIKEMTQIFVDAPAWYALCEVEKAFAADKGLSGIEYTPFGHTYYNEWHWV